MKTLCNVFLSLIMVMAFSGRAFAGSSDTLKTLPAIITENSSLKGKWLVSQNTLLQSGITLTMQPGSSLIFTEGVQLALMGNLNIAGSIDNLVQISSENPLKPGVGFVISDISGGEVNIRYASIQGLRKPFMFSRNWSRKKVSIEKCTFINNPCEGPLIEILEQDEIMGFKNCIVSISGNGFINNSGSVFISDLNSAKHQTIIRENVFSRNQFNGISSQGFFNTPMLINYMAHGNNPDPAIQNNAIYDNFSSTYEPGHVKSRRVNLCVTGSATNIDLKNNYLGASRNNELEATHQMLSEQFKVPFVVNSAPLQNVPKGLHAHLMEFEYNKLPVLEDEQIIQTAGGIYSMKLRFNAPMDPENPIQLRAFLMYKDTLYVTVLQNVFDWSENGTLLDIELPEAVGSDSSKIFLEISGLQDSYRRPLPAVNPSKKVFYAENNFAYDLFNLFDGRDIVALNEYAFKELLKKKENEVFIKKEETKKEKAIYTITPWEITLFSGAPLYFGDLVSTLGQISLYNLHSAWGPSVRYTVNNRLTIEAKNTNFRISGSDNKQTEEGRNRGTGYSRNLSFRTTVVELALMGYFNLVPSDKIQRWIPGIHAGITGFYFNPQGEYQGQWYNLRDIGTEGQTIGGDNRYSRFSLGTPVGMHVTRRLNQSFSITLSYTHTKLFTDYLDDVSTGKYPEANALREANPENPEAAVFLSNPSKLDGQRSSSDDEDAYSLLGISIGWRLHAKSAQK